VIVGTDALENCPHAANGSKTMMMTQNKNRLFVFIYFSLRSSRNYGLQERANETVEKPLVRKMFMKISHNGLKNCQDVAKMLCGTPKTRRFSAFLSHFSKIIFEKRLFRQSQRLALAAVGEG
jgi:hypothetical protein